MEAVMGPFPALVRPSLEVQELSREVWDQGITACRITYVAEPGDRVSAWLLRPAVEGRRPAMVCLHQTTRFGSLEPAGLEGNPHFAYARELARRGYVTLAPDYPGYNEGSGGGTRYFRMDLYEGGWASMTMKGIWNHSRALDVLVGDPAVDAARIGVIGHSLGGHNALFAAVFESRFRAVVSSCGFTAHRRYHNGDLRNWSHAGYMPRIWSVYHGDWTRVPYDFPEILAALGDRAVFVNAPLADAFDVEGVRECVQAAASRFAERKLEVVYPDCGHDFPDDARSAAYSFLDRNL